MKKTVVLLGLAFLTLSPAFGQRKKKNKKNKAEVATPVAQAPQGPQNLLDSVSYSFGVSFANNLLSQDKLDSLSTKYVLQGVEEVLNGKGAKWDENEATKIISTYFTRLKELEGAAVKQEGISFLEENKKREEILVTNSGLQIEKLVALDEGTKPSLTDKVKVHYTGTLINGTVFDSSVKRGKPAEFPVNAVIRGWVEALQMMKVGEKWKLYIPYDLAYGSRGTGSIPPYSTLIFEVELLDIVK